MDQGNQVAIIGAGPAGLTAGYLLSKEGMPVTVLEADPDYVGGIARTAQYKGYRFDIGGHRFFSKSREVEELWDELLPHDMLERPRSSRIYYRKQFFSYPLKAGEVLWKLGVRESALCVLSYLRARLFPVEKPTNFEDWVSNQFGKRLFNMFFKTYTEKVWGMSCKDISADWAVQRIKGLSLGTAIRNALWPRTEPAHRSAGIKTLIDRFRYPRYGPGMMWEAAAARIRALGNQVLLGMKVVGCHFDRLKKRWTVHYEDTQHQRHRLQAAHVISSAPLRSLVQGLTPRLSPAGVRAASSLRYRDFLTVVLILKDRQTFSDQWVYIHDPAVQVGRIQNFKAWSPEMVPDPAMTCYGLEYFCFNGDGLWSQTDAALIELGKRELTQVGLAKPEDVVDGCVVRQRKAYPVYDDDYAEHLSTVRQELEANYPNLHLVGRNGMHRYNNQDHAMMTAMLSVRNIRAGGKVYDLWRVNEDAEYHEETRTSQHPVICGLRQIPTRVKAASQPIAPCSLESSQ